MSLPTIVAPAGLPVFLAEGHAIDEDSVYAVVQMASGHRRQRRRWTVNERVVTVAWALSFELLQVCDEWYVQTLQKGALEFAARVANQGAGEALLWWNARWISYQSTMVPGFGGRVAGALYLTGEGSETGPT